MIATILCVGTEGEASCLLFFLSKAKLPHVIRQPFQTSSGHYHQTNALIIVQFSKSKFEFLKRENLLDFRELFCLGIFFSQAVKKFSFSLSWFLVGIQRSCHLIDIICNRLYSGSMIIIESIMWTKFIKKGLGTWGLAFWT